MEGIKKEKILELIDCAKQMDDAWEKEKEEKQTMEQMENSVESRDKLEGD